METFKNLVKEQNRKIRPLIWICYVNIAVSVNLIFLFGGYGYAMSNGIFVGLIILIVGLMYLIYGFSTIQFVKKHQKTYQSHRKDWNKMKVGGGLSLVFGLIFTIFSILIPFMVSWNTFFSEYALSDSYQNNSINSAFGTLKLLPLVSSLFSIILGAGLLKKNYQSTVTRFLFLSYLAFGGAWITFFLYNSALTWISIDETRVLATIYLGFYISLFIGVMFLIYACWRLITPSDKRFPMWLSLSLGITFLLTILLSFSELTHYRFEVYWRSSNSSWPLINLREHSLVYFLTYSISLIFPLIYSVYLLSKPPIWITKDRRQWINKTCLSVILLSSYPIIEVLSGLQGLSLFSSPISTSNPVPVKILLLTISVSLILISYLIMMLGAESVTKWFFDEIKFRATPELQEIDPDVNLAKIWDKLEQMQKEQALSPREMTNQKVSEYIQTAKKIMTEASMG